MTAPVRERLIAAILTAVGGVYALPTPDDTRDLPATYVQDGDDTATDSTYDFTSWQMPIAVARAALVVDGATRDQHRAQAHSMLAALITAMYADETFGGLATRVEILGGGIQIESGKLVFAEASFTVHYKHLRGQPAVVAVIE